MDRRTFLTGAAAATAANVWAQISDAQPQSVDLTPIFEEITKRHDEALTRLEHWIRQPAIAAENRGMQDGCDFTMQLLRDAGFQRVAQVSTDGHPGIFATLDAGAPTTLGLYLMYDVKQADPAEWSSPPFDPRLVDRPGVGQVLVGRGAVNQKGPQAALLAAVHAFRDARRPLPVNLVLVAEGEEEIGSPHLPQLVRRPDVQAAFSRSVGVMMPGAGQGPDGTAAVHLGAKGLVECELVSSGEKWGRGPTSDVHSSQAARLDSPVWYLVLALSSLVTADGQPAIDGFADAAKPPTRAEQAMIAEMVRRGNDTEQRKALGVTRWINDVSFDEALTRLVSRPTVNIEGIVGGYTGPGGMTILPHRAVAKLDLRLVPDMTAVGALAALKAHLAQRGFSDIEVNMTGGYDPTSTSAESALIRITLAVYRRAGLDPLVIPRAPGSWPGYVFTGAPLYLPANHFGLGHGGRAHAPDEFIVIDPTNPGVQGFDGAARGFVEFLYGIAEHA